MQREKRVGDEEQRVGSSLTRSITQRVGAGVDTNRDCLRLSPGVLQHRATVTCTQVDKCAATGYDLADVYLRQRASHDPSHGRG